MPWVPKTYVTRRCGAQDPDTAGAMLDHSNDVDLRAVEQVGGEEVQDRLPGLPV
jgi:hypothetical protein